MLRTVTLVALIALAIMIPARFLVDRCEQGPAIVQGTAVDPAPQPEKPPPSVGSRPEQGQPSLRRTAPPIEQQNTDRGSNPWRNW